jgi:xanthine dehydrogenase accessory factor
MSNDTRHLLKELIAAQAAGKSVALATVIRAQGSVPRHAGAKLLVYEDGRTSGTVGGGEMEALVVAAAREAMADGTPRLIPYSLVDPNRGDPGVCGGNVEIYVEAYLPPDTLFIIGAGHVGRALAALGKWLGYHVVVHDDRPELATPENVPDADLHVTGSFEAVLAEHPVGKRTYVALVTRNVTVDRKIVPALLATPAPFIGIMGSRRRWEETKRLLIEDGVPAETLERVTSPIGLELNAESPAEIAVSIMAQIIMVQRGGDGRAMNAPVAATHQAH